MGKELYIIFVKMSW